MKYNITYIYFEEVLNKLNHHIININPIFFTKTINLSNDLTVETFYSTYKYFELNKDDILAIKEPNDYIEIPNLCNENIKIKFFKNILVSVEKLKDL